MNDGEQPGGAIATKSISLGYMEAVVHNRFVIRTLDSLSVSKNYEDDAGYVPNEVLKLVGSDFVRCRAIAAAIQLGAAGEGNELNWQDLRTIYRRLAYRVFSFFPDPLLAQVEKADHEDCQRYKHFFIGVSNWLPNWDMERGLTDVFKRNGFESYKSYARLSELRYPMIRELCERKILPHSIFPRPSFPWLLTEASECRQRWNNRYRISSKRDSYDSRVKHLDGLEEQFAQTRTTQSFNDLLLNFSQYVEAIAHDLAQKDENFRKQYFKPYITNYRTWNKAASKLAGLTVAPAKVRGPNVREKNKEPKLRGRLRNIK